jgi:4-amino-4-deoxy-L-arabinose transferase-like glycosyltransferase
LLALLPVFMHAAWRHHGKPMKDVLRDPWVWVICLGLSLPWYIVAELKTPGFISYFVLGEHVMRFLQPGWKGDRYGFAHAQPLGIIWPYVALAGLPSVLVLLLGLPALRLRQGAGAVLARFRATGSDLAAYAVCITLAPLLIFTFARNLIWTYAMTALPGLAILAVAALSEAALRKKLALGAVAGWVALYGWAFFFKLPALGDEHSEKPLIAAFERACAGQDCRLVYAAKPPYSAYFYTAGKLYNGMPGAAGAPGFTIAPLPKNTPQPPDALACNKEQCLRRDSAP